MTTQEMLMILGPSLAGGIGSAVSNNQNNRQLQQNQQNNAVQMQMQALAQKAQMLQGLQQNRQQMAQTGLNAMPLGQEQAYVSRAKAMQALLPMLAQYQGARPTDPGIAGAIRSSGPNLVQGLAGNTAFQNTFSDQMTSQSLADRRKAIAGVNPQYEFSSLAGFGMDPAYDQTVDDARGTALARLKGFEGQQQALADQQVQLALSQANQQQQGQQEKKGGGIGGFLGGVLKTAAPFAAFIPGVGPLAAVGLGAAGGALGNKLQGGGLVSGAAQGAIGAGIGAAGKSLASGQGLNPFNNVAKGAQVYSQAAGPSFGQMAGGAIEGASNSPMLGLMQNMSTQMPSAPPDIRGQQVYDKPAGPQLPLFNKADPRGGPQQPPRPPSGMNPQSGIPLRNAAPYSGPPMGQQQGQVNPRGMNIGEKSLWDAASTTMLPGIGNTMRGVADYIDQPTMPQTDYPALNQMIAMMKGGAAGMLGGMPGGGFLQGGLAGEVDNATSPLGIAGLAAGAAGRGASMAARGPLTGQIGKNIPNAVNQMTNAANTARGARTAGFNQMWQQGMARPSLPTQQNARSIMQALSGNNGMTPEQKAQFLASPEAQRIMRAIVGGQ